MCAVASTRINHAYGPQEHHFGPLHERVFPSDYFGTLASIMKATGRSSEAAEMQNHADKLFQAANKQDESEE
jgi:hypothetical protein